MTTITTIAAIEAYTDARNSMTESRAHTLVLGDAMATAADHLVHDYDELVIHDEDASSRQCSEPLDHEGHYSALLELIRQEHDLYHELPFSICRHQTCREAAWLGQR